jgi:hypothetical protein
MKIANVTVANAGILSKLLLEQVLPVDVVVMQVIQLALAFLGQAKKCAGVHQMLEHITTHVVCVPVLQQTMMQGWQTILGRFALTTMNAHINIAMEVTPHLQLTTGTGCTNVQLVFRGLTATITQCVLHMRTGLLVVVIQKAW